MKLLAFTHLMLSIPVAAQLVPYWELTPVSGPPARYSHSMAYDPARAEAVLFGGNASGSFANDTWVFTGSAWTRRQVAGPSGRWSCGMAFDRASQVVILFGGLSAAGAQGDTWSWNGTQWTQLQPAQSPSPRSQANMVYDEVRKRIVLFGGMSSTSQALADTWEWDGTMWYPRFSAHFPPARFGHGMTYDTARGLVMMQGGFNGTGNPPAAGIWQWDGVDWSVLAGSGGSMAPTGSCLVYHPARRLSVALHGNTGSSVQTWTWDSKSWWRHTILAPSYRFDYQILFHEAADAIFLFGGSSGGGETWKLRAPASQGALLPYGQSCGPATVLAMAAGSAARIGAPFQLEVRNIPPTVTGGVLWIGGSKDYVGPFQLPLGLAFTGMPGCNLYQDLLLPQPLAISGGLGTWSVLIPPEPPLVGLRLYFQGFLALPGANLAGIIVTHGAELTVGSF